jgi:hypothetical protein
MRKKVLGAFSLLFIFVLFSCASQKNLFVFSAPDKSIFESWKSNEIGDITESRNMEREPYLPDWLSAYLRGGIEEAERIEAYTGRYLFITSYQGINFAALSKWADGYSVEYDFPLLVTARIEKRMNASNSMYPDEEYGIFYETFLKNSYGGEYQGAVMEGTYWIKTKVYGSNGGGEQDNAALPEVFIFYILISIDMAALQSTVNNLFSQAFDTSAPKGAQAAAINRLRQNFFEGF